MKNTSSFGESFWDISQFFNQLLIAHYQSESMRKKGKYNQKNDQQEGKKKNFIITEEHLMDKTHMEPTEYLPFLPSQSMYPPYNVSEPSLMTLRTTLKELNFMLYVDFKRFWATLLYNPSFKVCIHSCIQFFHRKWLNDYISKPAQEVSELNEKVYAQVNHTQWFQYTQALFKVVLLIYHRIMSFQEENPELSGIYNIKSEIVTKYILDVPRLLEIIEVYGPINEGVVKSIVKQFVNLSTTLYSDFTEEVVQPLIVKLNKSIMLIKRTTDREEFGIQYNYKSTVAGELSPGEMELQKKINLLMEIISFYETLNNIYAFFPTAWSESTRFNVELHSLSENLFIELEQAYKIWNHHEQADIMYALMNRILKYIVEYFVEFLEKFDAMFVTKTIKSNYKEAYMKCLDRMIENYGRRSSIGKKASISKRYMHMYMQILKVFKIDELTSKIYSEEVENNSYNINLEYLTDFKIAIDEQLIKLQGRPVHAVIDEQDDDKTEAGGDDDQQPIRKLSKRSQTRQQKQEQTPEKVEKQSGLDKQMQELSNLELMITKRNREEDYYSKLYKDYRAKITIEYEDEYDDLVDYEKRPMFEDTNKEEQDSSDGSSGDEFDSEVEQLHLVKSNSNVSRARGPGTQHHVHQKYDRKNKVKFVQVKESEARSIINREAAKSDYREKQKPVYSAKGGQKQEKEEKQKASNGSEYNDEDCYQQCRAKVKQDKQQNQKQRKEQIVLAKRRESDSQQEAQKQDQRGKGRGGQQQNNKVKGSNTNKKKYVLKE